MSNSLKVALVQLQVSDSLDHNIDQLFSLVSEIHDENVDLIVTPENSLMMKVNQNSPELSFDLSESLFDQIRSELKPSETLILGSVPVRMKNHTFNSSVLLSINEKARAVYNKIHLFDVDVEGHKPLRESDQFFGGDSPSIIEFKGWKIGLSICYDLRFSELYNFYAKNEVDIILVPSAFLVPTGKAHWHTLLRARAIENQCYVFAPAQVGPNISEFGPPRMSFGHSLAVDPWGRELVDLEEKGPCFKVLEINKNEIEKVRRQIPMANHRRL